MPNRLIAFTSGSAWSDKVRRFPLQYFNMMSVGRTAVAAAALAAVLAGPARSQPGMTLPARPDAAADKFTTLDKPVRRTISIACSKEADDQGLRGKARGKFRSACKRDKAAAAAATAATATDKPK
jgi:hypothetical protein